MLEINGKQTESEAGQTLFECAEAIGVRVPTSCFKNGKCRECLVEVVEGADLLTPKTEEEEHLREGFRLACRAKLTDADSLVRCHTLRRGAMRIQRSAQSLDDIPGPKRFDPAVTRDGNQIFLDGQPISESSGPILGLAIDVGTTTVVMRLVDLEDGAILEVHSFENPQRFAGSDIMARIQYDTEQKGRLLQRTLLAYLGHAIEALSCNGQSICEIVVAGNSTMRDLMFGLDVHSIGQRPYRSITEHELTEGTRSTTSVSTTARKMRLPVHPQARVYGLPIISGHVGADAAACALTVGLAHEERLVGLMDIGTNTELIVGNRHKLMAASCPAGPAFEGGKIRWGMPGLEGAIEAIRVVDSVQVEFDLIGDGPPQGICGSGLIDALSELRRTEHLNELGRFEDDSDRFVIDVQHDIAVYESDISELAQAKGANVAGLDIVLKRYGIGFHDLDRFYLAGGFARHLNLDAARRIGLVPDLPDGKLVQVGNAAIEGANRALCSVTARNELEQLVRSIEHVELETDPEFFDHFVEGCQFKRFP